MVALVMQVTCTIMQERKLVKKGVGKSELVSDFRVKRVHTWGLLNILIVVSRISLSGLWYFDLVCLLSTAVMSILLLLLDQKELRSCFICLKMMWI